MMTNTRAVSQGLKAQITTKLSRLKCSQSHQQSQEPQAQATCNIS
jgi:hypothetical protein